MSRISKLRRRMFLLFGVLLFGVGKPLYAGSSDREEILAAYRRADRAYEALDANAVFEAMLPTWYLIDEHGKQISRAKAFDNVSANFRRPPNEKTFAWRAITDVSSLVIAGDKASGRGTTHAEQIMENTAGVIANGSIVIVWADEWERTPRGWKIRFSHVLSQKVNVSAHVSPYVLEQLQQMQTMNNQLRDFNNGINFSNCMYSQGMQVFGYFERQQRCSQ